MSNIHVSGESLFVNTIKTMDEVAPPGQNIDVVRYFIKSGFNVNEDDGEGDSVLTAAIKNVIYLSMMEKVEICSYKLYVCECIAIVKILIDAGADVNEELDTGTTHLSNVIHMCLNEAYKNKMVSILVNAGAKESENLPDVVRNYKQRFAANFG